MAAIYCNFHQANGGRVTIEIPVGGEFRLPVKSLFDITPKKEYEKIICACCRMEKQHFDRYCMPIVSNMKKETKRKKRKIIVKNSVY